jgi:hypothetical protein
MKEKVTNEGFEEIKQELEVIKATLLTLTNSLTGSVDPAQYSIYKGRLGAAQFNFLPACYICKTCREKNLKSWNHVKNTSCTERMELKSGAILVEVTNGLSQHEYEWKNKIPFALDAGDLSAILNAFAKNEKIRCLHDPNMKQAGKQGQVIKVLEFAVGQEGGFILNLSQTVKGGTNDNKSLRHSVPLSGDEVRILRILFGAAIPKLLAWI